MTYTKICKTPGCQCSCDEFGSGYCDHCTNAVPRCPDCGEVISETNYIERWCPYCEIEHVMRMKASDLKAVERGGLDMSKVTKKFKKSLRKALSDDGGDDGA